MDLAKVAACKEIPPVIGPLNASSSPQLDYYSIYQINNNNCCVYLRIKCFFLFISVEVTGARPGSSLPLLQCMLVQKYMVGFLTVAMERLVFLLNTDSVSVTNGEMCLLTFKGQVHKI